MNTEQQQRLDLIQEKVKNKPRNYHADFHFLLLLVSGQEERGVSRVRRMNHEDYERIQETLDSLPGCPNVGVLLEENRQLRNEVADLRAACQHYSEQAKKAAEILLGEG